MRINFLIPTTGITGGIKVVFEHVNKLTELGHEINIVYPYVLSVDPGASDKLKGVVKIIRRKICNIVSKDKIKWFNLDARVNLIRVWDLSAKNILDADITVATANQTADWLVNYPESKGEKFYFIQDYEIWTRSKEKVDATWKMPLKKIVIAKWLKRLAEEKFNEKVYGIVPDGVDLNKFYNNNKTFNRKKKILMMHHALEKKGTSDGIKAFEIAKRKHLEITLVLFGAYQLKKEKSSGAEFYYQPPEKQLRELYSSSDIFLWPSRFEGFGLPPMEAMACKTAVISTDTGAIREYAVENETAVIVPPKNIDLMSEKLIELIEDEKKLRELSMAGYNKIKEFSWNKSSRILEGIFLESINSK